MQNTKLKKNKINIIKEALVENVTFEQIFFPVFFAIIGITLLLYSFGLRAPFQFDDIANITKNFSIRQMDAWSSIMRHTRWFGELTNKLNFQLGAFNPIYYRLFNLLNHLLAGLIGFFLFYFICSRPKNSTFIRNNAFSLSVISLSLFLLHPVQTQTVSYIIQGRLEGLATMLVLASLYFFCNIFDQGTRLKKLAFLFASISILFLACGAKEIAIVTPALAFIIDLFWISDFSWKELKSHLVYHICYFLITLLLMLCLLKPSFFRDVFSFSMATFNNRGNIITANPVEKISAYQFLISEFRINLHYLWIFIFPFNLCVEYDFVLNKTFFCMQVLTSFLVLAGITSFFVWAVSVPKLRPLSFGFFWFLIAMLPRTSIIPSAELACDYKTYLASLGIFWMIAYGISLFFEWLNFSNYTKIEKARNINFILLLTFCSGLTFQRNKIWADQVAFWMDIVQKNPGKARPLNNFGVALTEQGRYDEAIEKYTQAITLDAYYPDPLSNIAVVYSIKEDYQKAIWALNRALEIIPDYPEAYNNLAALYVKIKDVPKAIPLLKKAIELRAFYGKAHFNLGRCYLETQENDLAWQCFRNATLGDLDTAEGFNVFGQVSLMVKKYDVAIEAFTKAIMQGDSSFETYFNLGNAFYLDKKYADAENIYRKMLVQTPTDPRVKYNLAEAFFAQAKYTQARELFLEFKAYSKEMPQAIFRIAHCIEKIYGLNDALAFLEESRSLDLGNDGREMLKNELGRMRLQIRINSGNGTVNMQDMQDMFKA